MIAKPCHRFRPRGLAGNDEFHLFRRDDFAVSQLIAGRRNRHHAHTTGEQHREPRSDDGGRDFHFAATLSALAGKVLIDKTSRNIGWLNERSSPRTVLLRGPARRHHAGGAKYSLRSEEHTS